MKLLIVLLILSVPVSYVIAKIMLKDEADDIKETIKWFVLIWIGQSTAIFSVLIPYLK